MTDAKSTSTDQPEATPAASDSEKKARREPADDLVTSHHTLHTADGDLAYTATTGRVVLRQEVVKDEKYDGRRPKAEVSLTYYTLDGADVTERPVTFAFNGGPGSSSVWLHLGVLGPRRVDSGDVGHLTPPPYGLVDNHETLLRVSDLVFIDPVSTGFSRASEGEQATPFHGFTGDLESVGEIIRLWTSRHDRWMSPKFLIGESYGGTRSAALAEYLQQRFGMFLNGVMLIAPAFNLEALFDAERSNLPHPLFLPLYAATAHYHGLHGDRELDDVVAEARDWAETYASVLARGARVPDDERAAAVTKIAALTGLSEDYVDRANLRLEHTRVYAELLRSRRLVTGRLDTRFTGPADHYIHEQMPYDPFITAISGPYTAALHHYLRGELGYEHDAVYEVLSRHVHPWSFKEFEGKAVDVADKLATAMLLNPHLQVHVAMGRYDGGVPVEAIEYSLDQMDIPAAYRERIETRVYPAGHMMYIHPESRVAQAADLADFVRRASNR
ncbi:S10 family peptidase [Promicromonospora thailandica]|uniref:Carboxypeptidase C (Cathepsin A) n=1 Tax=Promicromonospora thailandica TaxID=765201 RepID=A0A9X2JWQ4_9MICO|nr:peptidase S10 [Promicromonospora thailandica]MCP2263344.1 Carboxypeptidase C (cathepsin A) [Promicromonospora thailandica]BFF19506.1 peptidase S10 [Promicromonospora thailandica]